MDYYRVFNIKEYLLIKNLNIKDKRAHSKETNIDLPSLNYLEEYEADKVLLKEFEKIKKEKFS